MSLDSEERSDGESAAERLAELTGEPVETFRYEGAIPDPDEQEWTDIDE